MLAVIYARYSDSKQREESIEGQLKVCHEYCKRNGYTVIQEYIDRAQSGKTDDRTQFQKMIQDSKKKQFQVVIVYSLDRFGRNLQQSTDNEYKLQKNGVTLLSATENFADNPAGRMQRNMLMTFAQYYSDELAQKVTRGMMVNAEKGLSTGGMVPLGYKIENHKYVLNDKASIVKEIFTKYANGDRIKDICEDLNKRGIKNSKGKEFKPNSFNAILKNRKYLGIYIYKDIEIPGGMPQIIDEDLFNKVAVKMKANKKAPARARAKADYLLTTKLFCGYCKEMMVGHSSNKISKGGIIYNYYKCKNAGASKKCKKKMVMKDYIEDIVISECRKLLTPDNIRRIAKELAAIARSYDDTSEVVRLENLIKETNEAKNNQIYSLRECTVEDVRKMILQDLEKIATEIKELEHQLEIERSRHYEISEERIIEFLTGLSKGNVKDKEYRKTLVKVLVNKIFLYDDRFTITFNSGDEEVTITDKLLAEIDKQFRGEKVCLLKENGYQPRYGVVLPHRILVYFY